METPRVVLVVSTDPSDLYFANLLSRRLNAVAVVVEEQRCPEPGLKKLARWGAKVARFWDIPALLKERSIIARHVRQSGAIDRAGFGDDGYRLRLPDSCQVIELFGKKALNATGTVEILRGLAPDLLLLCGCSIVKKELLSVPRLGTLNLHGGLAQRYRGVWTTLWAIVNREPEYVGATVHFVSPGIDDGDIVFQGRPEIDPNDNAESLYVKVVKLGIEMMTAAALGVAAGTVRRHPLEAKGKLYLAKMVTAKVLERAWRATEEGVIPAYLARKQERDAAVLEAMRGRFTG